MAQGFGGSWDTKLQVEEAPQPDREGVLGVLLIVSVSFEVFTTIYMLLLHFKSSINS